jgi:hypothetical protein
VHKQELIIKVFRKCSKVNSKYPKCSSLDIYVIIVYCYMFQSMRDQQGLDVNCQIFYKELYFLQCFSVTPYIKC